MSFLVGKIKNIIYNNAENNYSVVLFKVKESDIKNIIDKSIMVTGTLLDLKLEVPMKLTGNYTLNEKYNRYQFNFDKYEIILPDKVDQISEFLKSSFIAGCGKKTADKLVDFYGDKTLEKIKDINNLLKVPGITEKVATKINASILAYDKTSDTIIKLETMGFSIDEASRIINKFKDNIINILEKNFYALKEVIDFKKIDMLYINNFKSDSDERIYHCILAVCDLISFQEGHIFYSKDLIIKGLKVYFNILINEDKFDEIINILLKDYELTVDGKNYYLKSFYDAEQSIAQKLKKISKNNSSIIKDFDEKIVLLEDMLNINYDDVQKKAIKEGFSNNITIISGGPGTGKTTILNALVKLYISENKLSPVEVVENIALLAPTGRASKKMMQATNLPAYTIHRYLKWHKESDSFEYNEDNQTAQKLIVVDESSMIDLKLFNSLLCALKNDVKLVLVGDAFQLPSVSAGQVFKDLIDSELFNFIPLTKIYRQSDNSFIPYLAKSIKNNDLEEEFLNKKDDYNFILCDQSSVKSYLEKVILSAKNKGLSDSNIQVLLPMYKGENGIDSINRLLQSIYNPRNFEKKECVYNDVIFREGDKVLQLTNDPDNNIFNGDIGYIKEIISEGKVRFRIDFENNDVIVEKNNFKNLKHAYAISIHKSQGSEFDHVVMPISREYFVMMYNKLLYTGVSRAKKSLILLGDAKVFCDGVRNNRTDNRNSNLKNTLTSIIIEN